MGSNGAGKITLLRILSGLELVKSGSILYQETDLTALKPYEKADLGIAHIPQGRGILGSLTVKENLMMGAYPKRAREAVRENMKKAFDMFTILLDRQNQTAGPVPAVHKQLIR